MELDRVRPHPPEPERDPYDDGILSRQPTPLRIQRAAPLDTMDIFALIVNKMVGTGVYTAPAAVYLLTGNKGLALGLWAVGYVYSIIR